MKKGGLGLMLGGQKSSKMMTFSKHEKHEKSMLYTAYMRLKGVQTSTKNESGKHKKTKFSSITTNYEKIGKRPKKQTSRFVHIRRLGSAPRPPG